MVGKGHYSCQWGPDIGNQIVTKAGPPLVVQSIQWNRRVEGYKVYNFVVEEDHTYFVGTHNGGTWVHNPTEYEFNNLDKVAQDLHSLLSGAELRSTTAAGSAMYNGERVIVVSRNLGLTEAQIAEAKQLGYHFFDDPRLPLEHAEPYMIRVGESRGYMFDGQGMGVSNPNGICPPCMENWLEPRKITPQIPPGRKFYP